MEWIDATASCLQTIATASRHIQLGSRKDLQWEVDRNVMPVPKMNSNELGNNPCWGDIASYEANYSSAIINLKLDRCSEHVLSITVQLKSAMDRQR